VQNILSLQFVVQKLKIEDIQKYNFAPKFYLFTNYALVSCPKKQN